MKLSKDTCSVSRKSTGWAGDWRHLKILLFSIPFVTIGCFHYSSRIILPSLLSFHFSPNCSLLVRQAKGEKHPHVCPVASILCGDYVEKSAGSYLLCFGESPSPFGSSPSISVYVLWVLRADVLVDVLLWFPRWPRLKFMMDFPSQNSIQSWYEESIWLLAVDP